MKPQNCDGEARGVTLGTVILRTWIPKIRLLKNPSVRWPWVTVTFASFAVLLKMLGLTSYRFIGAGKRVKGGGYLNRCFLYRSCTCLSL